MSKPNKPGELRDVTVDAISLVSKAANGEKFKIFKSTEPEDTGAPEVVQKDEQGLFSGEKGQKLMQFNELFLALKKTLKLDTPDGVAETDNEKITRAIDEFRVASLRILQGSASEQVKKDAGELSHALTEIFIDAKVEKSGRKISGSRLSKIIIPGMRLKCYH